MLKLDTTYTQRLTSEADTRIIAEAITMMADRLGLMVVAEGVETNEHLEVIRELGITRAQGYLLGRPAPAERLRPTARAEGIGGQPAGLSTSLRKRCSSVEHPVILDEDDALT